MDRLDEMRAFVAVADARSFTRGAGRLGTSTAQVSKAIARLEDRLGARLLHRTTRDVSLTDTGQAYLERARELVDTLEALDASVRDTGKPRGLLKLSAPTVFGAAQLAPALLDFAAAYPELGLEVSFADRFVNLVEEGFDAAVRISRLADSSLTGRKIAETRVVTLASPAWLEQHGTPASPTELATSETILDLNASEPTLWDYGGGAFRFDVRVSGRLRFSDLTLCLAAARAGFGVARACYIPIHVTWRRRSAPWSTSWPGASTASRNGTAGGASPYPLFLSPAAMPLMVRWTPSRTASSVSPARRRRISSICRWLSGSI
jgi:DNA-binding transcriptional LysR family regulator